MARRYIVRTGVPNFVTPAGVVPLELWIGIEIEGPVNLPYLSTRGYDLIPADGFSRVELASVGVEHFEMIELPTL